MLGYTWETVPEPAQHLTPPHCSVLFCSVTQMLKACDSRKLKHMVELESATTQVLRAGYTRIFGYSKRKAPKVLPSIVKIQWLRSFNVKHRTSSKQHGGGGGEGGDGMGVGINAQDLHRDYEMKLGTELIAHSCIYTLAEESKLIVLVRWGGCVCGKCVGVLGCLRFFVETCCFVVVWLC